MASISRTIIGSLAHILHPPAECKERLGQHPFSFSFPIGLARLLARGSDSALNHHSPRTSSLSRRIDVMHQIAPQRMHMSISMSLPALDVHIADD
jgi:hypothetical protein